MRGDQDIGSGREQGKREPGGAGQAASYSGDSSTGNGPDRSYGYGEEVGSGFSGEEGGRDYPDNTERSDEERPHTDSSSSDEERGGLE